MNIPWNKIVKRWLMAVCLLIIAATCTDSPSDEKLEKYIHLDELIVREAMREISTDNNQYLLFSKDLCRKCFREITNHFEEQKQRGQVILLGANDYDVKRLNTIYQKSLKFLKGEFKEYGALQSKYPSVIRGYVRYVEINSDTLIYEGIGKNRTERTIDVLKFFVERDKSKS